MQGNVPPLAAGLRARVHLATRVAHLYCYMQLEQGGLAVPGKPKRSAGRRADVRAAANPS
jgi:hypothetical protein